jgi:uncharacterized protein (TIGR02996 family)
MSGRAGEDRAFLEAIRDAPEDDTPRLVFADWLEDHGDPARATFIRVQCELARLPDEARRVQLEAQERDLLVANRAAWLGPLHKELAGGHCTFRRGFPEDLTVRPKTIVKLAEEFDGRVPAGRVTLSGGFGNPAMKALVGCPSLGWIVGLKYEYPRVAEAGLEMIGHSPDFTHLQELLVKGADFTTNGLLALTTSSHRIALRRLSLSHSSWRGHGLPDTATALAAEGVQFRLRTLSLHHHEMGPAGAAMLAGTKNLAEVKDLDLMVNGIDDGGAIALARSPHLRGLSSLCLQTNDLTVRSVRELADSPLIDGVRSLNLAANNIGHEGAEALAASGRLGALERLSLWAAHITDRGAEALAASPHLANLKVLELHANAITERGSQALYDSPYLQRLERVTIGWHNPNNRVSSERQRKQWQKRLGKGARQLW